MAEKKKTGRKSKFDPKMIKEAKDLAEQGLIDDEMAEYWNVTKQTLNNWKKDFPAFFDSLKKGKRVADEKVVMSLFQRATGYSHPDTHISGAGGYPRAIPIVKHYPPDVTAIIFWLCNRQRENWRSINKENGYHNPKTPVSIDFKFSVVKDER